MREIRTPGLCAVDAEPAGQQLDHTAPLLAALLDGDGERGNERHGKGEHGQAHDGVY
jgi:hypothetical protein